MTLAITAPTRTTRDLMAEGFSRTEIHALETLRAKHNPFREFFESNQEFEQLAFLKWRIAQGAFARAQGTSK